MLMRLNPNALESDSRCWLSTTVKLATTVDAEWHGDYRTISGFLISFHPDIPGASRQSRVLCVILVSHSLITPCCEVLQDCLSLRGVANSEPSKCHLCGLGYDYTIVFCLC